MLLPNAKVTTWLPGPRGAAHRRPAARARAPGDAEDGPEPERPVPVRPQRRPLADGGRLHAPSRGRPGGRLLRRLGARRPAQRGGRRRDGGEGHRHQSRAAAAVGRRDRPSRRRHRDDGLRRRLPVLSRQALRRLGARRPLRQVGRGGPPDPRRDRAARPRADGRARRRARARPEPVRLAIFSDVHANLPALEAVLADIAAVGVDARYALGDLVGYAPWPNEVLERLAAEGFPIVMGNYDNGTPTTARSAAAPTPTRWRRRWAIARSPGPRNM